MVKLLNRAKVSTSTTGTGGIVVLGSADTGYRDFYSAGAVTGDELRYVVEDGDNWEIGTGIISGMPTGLSDSLFSVSGQSGSWVQRTVNLSAYAGATVRLVFSHQVAASGTTYFADLQLDQIAVDGTTYSFESSTENFQTTPSGSYTNYTDASFISLGTGATSERWNRDLGGTPSSSTGLTTGGSGTNYYVYTESSSPVVNNDIFWLRSPQISLSQSVQNLTFYEARLGGTIGTLNVYVDVVSGGSATLTRSVVESSNSGSRINLSGSAYVFSSSTAQDFSGGGLAETLVDTSTTSQTAIASYAVSDYTSAKLLVTAKRGTDRQTSELLIVHDDTTAFATEYAQIYTGEPLATFDVDISGGNVRLLATPSSATTTNYTIKEILVNA